jgi:formylglycine-generating enzyme required for sulfatase activity/serine/threonine protein kinase
MEIQFVSSQALPAGTRIEEFVIERVLGSGGFGITYLARDARLNRRVVIKENLPVQFCFRDPGSLSVAPRHTTGEDQDNFRWSLENFSKESAMLASLDHVGIVKVLRSFEAFGTAYFVMPFVEGVTLDELHKERRDAGEGFSEDELRGMLERVLDGLVHLHDRGIYHRDIKPGNILITSEGVPVLIDFGSARQRLSERSMTVVESAGYTPFEQLQSRGNVGPWSDLYSLAATLVKVMTGEAPPKAMDRMRKDPLVPLVERGKLRSQYSEYFLRTLGQALAVDEGERWQDARIWKSALVVPTPQVIPLPPVPSPLEPTYPRPTLDIGRDRILLGNENNKREHGESPNKIGPWDIVLAIGMIGVACKAQSKQIAMSLFRIVLAIGIIWVAWALMSGEFTSPESISKLAGRSILYRIGRMWSGISPESISKLEGERAGEEREFEIAPGVRMTMCWIPAGEFVMGSPPGETGRSADETQHLVALTRGFWLGKTETTQAQWRAVMLNKPSGFTEGSLPVCVSWDDAQNFIEKVNNGSGIIASGWKLALPTEAQWEYAARADEAGPYSGGTLDQVGWYEGNSGGKTHAVGGKKPNGWGLHDMHGNVWEWCTDWYGEQLTNSTDPVGSFSGAYRVFRGGSWDNDAYGCRVADRYGADPSNASSIIGFRVARSSVQ